MHLFRHDVSPVSLALARMRNLSAPKNRKEALQSPWWEGYHAAEYVEMESHAKNGTWKLCPRSEVPPGTPVGHMTTS